jgi:hypothetical protein
VNCLNKTVIFDHNGIFIDIDIIYPGKFHDVNILRLSALYRDCRAYLEHGDEYFEYLLGDLGYVGAEMFIMRRVGRQEIPEGSFE